MIVQGLSKGQLMSRGSSDAFPSTNGGKPSADGKTPVCYRRGQRQTSAADATNIDADPGVGS
jgi:hypothetical protein